MTATRTYPAGVPSWVDLDVPDLDAAQAFYAGLFGWAFADASADEPRRYLLASMFRLPG
jgi:predicted enzyme related to lactoylglutathione lyase